MSPDLEDCLPAALRGEATTITRVAAGLSGAGVYRVDAAGAAYVLKIARADEPVEAWRCRIEIVRAAAAAGVAPAVIHVDDDHRAVTTAFVVDRGLMRMVGTPATRDGAIALVGQALRRVHDLPAPAALADAAGLALLARLEASLAGHALPAFVGEAVRRIRAEPAPPSDRPPVVSHNDVNPSNLMFDGERVILLDWDTASRNDPYFDLAAFAVFARLDDAAGLGLLAAHDGAAATALPDRFRYDRRLVATMCGAAFLHLARHAGHPGGTPGLADTRGLGDVYQQMRAGTLSPGTPDGQWQFGLALLKAALEL